MIASLNDFALRVKAPWVSTKSVNYRPDAWPPSRAWPVSLDANGDVLSRWGDSLWDFTALAGRKFSINFGDGDACQAGPLDPENADLLRLTMTWLIWGPRGSRTPENIQQKFTIVRAVFTLCSLHGISAARLTRFPEVFDLLPSVFAPSRYETTVAILHRLYDAREVLGFTIVDEQGLQRLTEVAPEHEKVQTPYIPPRIWVYQLERLRECLTDFHAHAAQIKECYQFCIDAYAANYGSLVSSLVEGKDGDRGPFNRNSRSRLGCTYQGAFVDTATRFGINNVLSKWVVEVDLSSFSAYFTLVTHAGAAYIANFTLQRRKEVASLKTSCLIWEEDEKLGRVPIICGPTTKTLHDSDARWVASPSVEIGVSVLSTIAWLRMKCDSVNPAVNPSKEDLLDPYLISVPTEPWAGGVARPYNDRSELASLGDIIRSSPKLFDMARLQMSSEDIKIAKHLTPNLPPDSYAVGKVWPLAWHQYRRTGAVNMFASGLISDSSMQEQMKHSSRLMPLYYGRGYSKLRLNEKVETLIVNAMYSAMAERLQLSVTGRFVSPPAEGKTTLEDVNLLSMQDRNKLIRWAKEGKVSFREHRLGGCMSSAACEYGGIESIAHCAGGDGDKACLQVRYDRQKELQIRTDLRRIIEEIGRQPAESPRKKALLAEKRGMENYLNAIAIT